MATSKRLFTVQCPHGPGGVFFAWQRASGGYLATTGYDQIVNIYNRYDSFLFIFRSVYIFNYLNLSKLGLKLSESVETCQHWSKLVPIGLDLSILL